MRQILQRCLVWLTLLALLAGVAPTKAVAAAGFQDVPADHWAADSIRQCVEQGYFQGKSATQFGLGQGMTRSAFAVVLCRFFGWETETPTGSSFQDVPVTAWYAGAVEAAYAHGAVTDQRAEFRPEEAITREELAVMLVRALGYGTIAGLAQDLTSPFRDVTTNDGYITMAYDLGLVSGTTATTFSPGRAATREQVAVILMRLHDKLYTAAPTQIAILSASAKSGTVDLTGLTAAAIPAGQLTRVNGRASIRTLLSPDTAAALQERAQQAGVQTLLYLTGTASVLDGTPEETASVLAQAVSDGGYDGLFLDIPQLPTARRNALTKLAQALDSALGDAPLYLATEAPAWVGESYGGYDYAALATAADRLVLRVTSYETTASSFPTAPVEPLEEVYYALASLRGTVAADKLTLLVTTAPSVWNTKTGVRRELSAERLSALLRSGEAYYSARYACAYLTGSSGGETLVAWYLNRQAIQARSQLAGVFGVGQLCLTDWTGPIEN